MIMCELHHGKKRKKKKKEKYLGRAFNDMENACERTSEKQWGVPSWASGEGLCSCARVSRPGGEERCAGRRGRLTRAAPCRQSCSLRLVAGTLTGSSQAGHSCWDHRQKSTLELQEHFDVCIFVKGRSAHVAAPRFGQPVAPGSHPLPFPPVRRDACPRQVPGRRTAAPRRPPGSWGEV